MTPRLLPGLFADAIGDAFAVMQPGVGILTHVGLIPLPPGEPWGLMFLRLSMVGGFHLAGLSHESSRPRLWEWRGAWSSRPTPFGRGCYDQQGVYQDILPAGYQFCADDGRPVPRTETYAPRHDLSEWTERGGFVFGQLQDDGIGVWDGAVLRRLNHGYTIFVNVNGGPDVFSIAWADSTIGSVGIQTITRDELLALPPVAGAPPPDRDPIPPPAPPPHNPNPPAPDPPPARPSPPAQPAPPFPVAHPSGVQQMKVFLRLNGYYVGVQPGTTQVYTDRAAGGAWEEVRLDAKGGGLFVATFVAADAVLSIQPNGRLETRPPGTDGPYELARATSQPEGLDILYRVDGVKVLGVPLTIEEIK